MKNIPKIDYDKVMEMLAPKDGCSCNHCGNVSLKHPYKKAGSGWGFCSSKKCKLFDMQVQLGAVRTCRAYIPMSATVQYDQAQPEKVTV